MGVSGPPVRKPTKEAFGRLRFGWTPYSIRSPPVPARTSACRKTASPSHLPHNASQPVVVSLAPAAPALPSPPSLLASPAAGSLRSPRPSPLSASTQGSGLLCSLRNPSLASNGGGARPWRAAAAARAHRAIAHGRLQSPPGQGQAGSSTQQPVPGKRKHAARQQPAARTTAARHQPAPAAPARRRSRPAATADQRGSKDCSCRAGANRKLTCLPYIIAQDFRYLCWLLADYFWASEHRQEQCCICWHSCR
ncbi:uncharacterized protein [Miscanthus floridulus]|uniref:uncharacterized protein n=1 Tax=Miscanthus floridulus TaxID=154761 RepID=UPI0034596474